MRVQLLAGERSRALRDLLRRKTWRREHESMEADVLDRIVLAPYHDRVAPYAVNWESSFCYRSELIMCLRLVSAFDPKDFFIASRWRLRRPSYGSF